MIRVIQRFSLLIIIKEAVHLGNIPYFDQILMLVSIRGERPMHRRQVNCAFEHIYYLKLKKNRSDGNSFAGNYHGFMSNCIFIDIDNKFIPIMAASNNVTLCFFVLMLSTAVLNHPVSL